LNQIQRRLEHTKFAVFGQREMTTALEITELPIGHLDCKLQRAFGINDGWVREESRHHQGLFVVHDVDIETIADYKDYHTDTTVHFIIECLEGKLAELEKSGQVEKVTPAAGIN